MPIAETERRCGFCSKRIPKPTHKYTGSPKLYCRLLHRQYATQVRYLTGLRSRLQSENSKL